MRHKTKPLNSGVLLKYKQTLPLCSLLKKCTKLTIRAYFNKTQNWAVQLIRYKTIDGLGRLGLTHYAVHVAKFQFFFLQNWYFYENTFCIFLDINHNV